MKFIALLLSALLTLTPVAYAEAADANADVPEGETQTVQASDDSEAIIAEKDARIADLEAQLAELQARYDELLAQSAYITLSKGSKGEDVSKMQERLIALGYLEGSADGAFGSGTEAAVTRFQRMAGLEATGTADGKTQSALFAEDAPKATTNQSGELDPEQYEQYDYSSASNEPEAYNGRKVQFTGKVLQALESGGTAIFRIATSGEKNDVVYATYVFAQDEERVYKGDSVTVYAVTAGTKTYDTVTGNSVTVPACEVQAIAKNG